MRIRFVRTREGLTMADERPVPEAALRDKKSLEVLRVWIAEHALHCSIKVGAFEGSSVPETKAWGIILADTAKHLTNALCENSTDRDYLREITKSFIEEVENPTSKATGSFVD